MLFGSTECVAVTIGPDGTLHVLRCEFRRKTAVITAAETFPPGADTLGTRLKQAGNKIGLKKEHTLVLGPADCSGVFFRTAMPEMPQKELRSALQFEAPRHLLLSGESPHIVFWARPHDDAAPMDVWAWTVPDKALAPLLKALQEANWRPDAILSPYLAAAPLGGGEAGTVSLPEFDPGFFWQNGSFHPEQPGMEYNGTLKKRLQEEFQLAGSLDQKVWDEYLACIMLCCSMLRQERRTGDVRDLNLVPPALRPRRLRSQLRLTVLLSIGCLLLYGGRFLSSSIDYYGQYRKLSTSVRTLKQRTTAMQRKLRAKEKDLKEMSRILDGNTADSDLLLLLADLSGALPDNVLASSVRLNESGMDLTLHTSQENVDLAASLQKFPAYKIGTLQNRKLSDTLTMITLRMKRSQEKK